MNHTLIFQPATWNISGVLFTTEDKLLHCSGKCQIIHEKVWNVYLEINSENDPQFTIKQSLEIENPDILKSGLSYIAEHSRLGKIIGRYMISDDHIISVFESSGKSYSATEYFKRVSDQFYKNRGIIFEGESKFLSWSLDYKRND